MEQAAAWQAAQDAEDAVAEAAETHGRLAAGDARAFAREAVRDGRVVARDRA